MTHYEVLELRPGATDDEVHSAFERLRRLLGPDSLAVYSLVDPEEQRAHWLRIEEAHQVLADRARRRAYDLELGLPAEEAPGDAAASSFQDALQRINRARQAAPIDLADDDVVEVLEDAAIEAPEQEAADPPPPPLPPPAPARQEARAPVAEEPAPPPPPERPSSPSLPPDAEVSGPLLRELRESRGLTLDELARRTRINPMHLRHLEEDRFGLLPERVYLRGILASYARELRLDPGRVCDSYLRRAGVASR